MKNEQDKPQGVETAAKDKLRPDQLGNGKAGGGSQVAGDQQSQRIGGKQDKAAFGEK